MPEHLLLSSHNVQGFPKTGPSQGPLAWQSWGRSPLPRGGHTLTPEWGPLFSGGRLPPLTEPQPEYLLSLAPDRRPFFGHSLASCQRVGAGQAWAHQLLQLLHGF